jgi:hypothetical protein
MLVVLIRTVNAICLQGAEFTERMFGRLEPDQHFTNVPVPPPR